ncbi:MAG: hypothetical protein JXA42_26120, partial [Anaerolineales bacterium]|nr:hypothetical protein [Anaerolineales bacterium]
MKNAPLISLFSLLILLCTISFLSAGAQPGDGLQGYDRTPIHPANPAGDREPQALGDELFRIDLTASTGHECIVGVEYIGDSYIVTSGGADSPADSNRLLVILEDGSVLFNKPQATSSDWGWRDLAYDGVYIYGSDSDVIEQIDLGSFEPTGVTILVPVNPARGLAYDPATDHFWAVNYGSDLYEIARDGAIVNNFSNSLAIYGLAWDPWSDGGPYLWAWSQDGSPGVTATQIDPDTGIPTGVSFQGSSLDGSDLAAGADIDNELVEGKLTLITIHQANSDTMVGYEISEETQEIPVFNKPGYCITTDEAPFALLNQPWDWVEGMAEAGETVNAALKRASVAIANGSGVAGADGWFEIELLDGGVHADVQVGDVIEVAGGGLDAVITVPDIAG